MKRTLSVLVKHSSSLSMESRDFAGLAAITCLRSDEDVQDFVWDDTFQEMIIGHKVSLVVVVLETDSRLDIAIYQKLQ